MLNLRLNIQIIMLFIFAAIAFNGSIITAKDMVKQKAVLVTGASTGIGKKVTEQLSAKGYYVYAGARKEKDLKALDAMKNVKSVRLDVNKQDEIDAAVEMISKAGRGLYGLVNNAGVAILAPLIEAEEAEMQFQMNVNVFGPYRITKAFAPLIIESKGRITTIGSISGIGSGHFFGPYSMTKHAMEAFTDSLAVEMAKFDVQVSVVEPGNYDSKIGKTLLNRMKKNKFSFDKSLYKDEYERLMASFDGDRSKYKSPEEVADSVEHALFAEKPKRRYLTVPNKGEARWTISTIMKEMLQLNEGQPYTYSRDELIKMMDELSAAK